MLQGTHATPNSYNPYSSPQGQPSFVPQAVPQEVRDQFEDLGASHNQQAATSSGSTADLGSMRAGLDRFHGLMGTVQAIASTAGRAGLASSLGWASGFVDLAKGLVSGKVSRAVKAAVSFFGPMTGPLGAVAAMALGPIGSKIADSLRGYAAKNPNGLVDRVLGFFGLNSKDEPTPSTGSSLDKKGAATSNADVECMAEAEQTGQDPGQCELGGSDAEAEAAAEAAEAAGDGIAA